MAGQLIECVPNFSEGRDSAVVAAIGAAIAAVPGARVLRSEMDPDHNRSVITFAASDESAGDAAFAGIKTALADGDLSTARRLVNGGSNGLDRFTGAFHIGQVL